MKFQIQNLRYPALRSFSEGGTLQRSPAEEALEEFRQAWSIGTETFRRECLERMDGKVGENHPGQTRLQTASAKADRILSEESARFHWTEHDLAVEQKSHPFKLALAARLRQETTLSVKQIAERLHLGKPKGARTNLHKFINNSRAQTLQFDWTPNEQ